MKEGESEQEKCGEVIYVLLWRKEIDSGKNNNR